MKERVKLTIKYRVLDEDGKTVAVIKKTGYNKKYLLWQIERMVKNKYGRGRYRVHAFKVQEVP